MQIEVMSLRGSQWLQLFLEQAQIGQMVEHWCKEHPVACSTYYHWKKALREEFLARMEAEQGHPILQTAVTVLFNQSEGCLRLLSATGLPSTKQFAHWHLACPHGSENPDSGAPNSRRSVHKSATVWTEADTAEERAKITTERDKLRRFIKNPLRASQLRDFIVEIYETVLFVDTNNCSFQKLRIRTSRLRKNEAA